MFYGNLSFIEDHSRILQNSSKKATSKKANDRYSRIQGRPKVWRAKSKTIFYFAFFSVINSIYLKIYIHKINEKERFLTTSGIYIPGIFRWAKHLKFANILNNSRVSLLFLTILRIYELISKQITWKINIVWNNCRFCCKQSIYRTMRSFSQTKLRVPRYKLILKRVTLIENIKKRGLRPRVSDLRPVKHFKPVHQVYWC